MCRCQQHDLLRCRATDGTSPRPPPSAGKGGGGGGSLSFRRARVEMGVESVVQPAVDCSHLPQNWCSYQGHGDGDVQTAWVEILTAGPNQAAPRLVSGRGRRHANPRHCLAPVIAASAVAPQLCKTIALLDLASVCGWLQTRTPTPQHTHAVLAGH